MQDLGKSSKSFYTGLAVLEENLFILDFLYSRFRWDCKNKKNLNNFLVKHFSNVRLTQITNILFVRKIQTKRRKLCKKFFEVKKYISDKNVQSSQTMQFMSRMRNWRKF